MNKKQRVKEKKRKQFEKIRKNYLQRVNTTKPKTEISYRIKAKSVIFFFISFVFWFCLFFYDTGLISNRNVFETYSGITGTPYASIRVTILLFFITLLFIIVGRRKIKLIYFGYAFFIAFILSIPITFIKVRFCTNVTKASICRVTKAEISDIKSSNKHFEVFVRFKHENKFIIQRVHTDGKIKIPQFREKRKMIIGDTVVIQYPMYSYNYPFLLINKGSKQAKSFNDKYLYCFRDVYYKSYNDIPESIRIKNDEVLFKKNKSERKKLFYYKYRMDN